MLLNQKLTLKKANKKKLTTFAILKYSFILKNATVITEITYGKESSDCRIAG